MSKLIPAATVEAIRKMGDVSVDTNGIDCDLYVPSDVPTVENRDMHSKSTDYTFTHYTGMVYIEWSPNNRRLRSLGIFTEQEQPIIARFGRRFTNDSAAVVNVDQLVNSYIKISLNYVPSETAKTNEFEIVDLLTGKMHDSIMNKVYKLAPRRV